MKLFMCEAVAIDYEPRSLIVAESEKDAAKKFEESLDDSGDWYSSTSAYEIKELDGYRIILEQIK